jgi:arylsulfatase A-like enzyme
MKTRPMQFALLVCVVALCMAGVAQAADQKPNILVIWGDDVGQSNISAYSKGLMGYQTPNIDRIAREGILFTDYYGEQSCTAGRSSFIMGQSVFRTGLSKVGLPGAKEGMMVEDPTIAVLLKDQGYATGQFGKNHLGDRDEHLPTNHGFDEFYGNLYHLNAEEEPENEDYPGDLKLADGRTFRQAFGPRGVIRSFADGRIEDTGPLTRKRMETVDDDTAAAAIDFIRRQTKAGKPWFVWWNGTRMHFRTHVSPEKMAEIKKTHPNADEYTAGMIEHDMHIGQFLAVLDELGIADKTIVHYSTDNGPHMNTWPDAAMTPFRGEKNTNWEGGWRVPAAVRWPGVVTPGSVSNGIVHHMDWLPTFLAAAGKTDIKEDLLDGYKSSALGRDYKIHLDGYNLTDHLKDPQGHPQPPQGDILLLGRRRPDGPALRGLEAHLHGATRRGDPAGLGGTLCPASGSADLQPAARPVRAFAEDLEHLLRLDDRPRIPVGSGAGLRGQVSGNLQDFPPRQKAASFSLEKVMEKLSTPGGAQ